MKLEISSEEIKKIHSDFYENDAELLVAAMKRSGPLDFFPFSLAYGLSDIGSWDCLLSTDGEKVFITKSSYLNISKVTNKWCFKLDEIQSCTFGITKIRINLKSKFKGLTMWKPSFVPGIIPLMIPCLIGFVLLFLKSGTTLNLRLTDHFGDYEQLKNKLSR
jgi:hypothetical protein